MQCGHRRLQCSVNARPRSMGGRALLLKNRAAASWVSDAPDWPAGLEREVREARQLGQLGADPGLLMLGVGRRGLRHIAVGGMLRVHKARSPAVHVCKDNSTPRGRRGCVATGGPPRSLRSYADWCRAQATLGACPAAPRRFPYTVPRAGWFPPSMSRASVRDALRLRAVALQILSGSSGRPAFPSCSDRTWNVFLRTERCAMALKARFVRAGWPVPDQIEQTATR